MIGKKRIKFELFYGFNVYLFHGSLWEGEK
jgi:hypothetical protein